MSGTGPCTCSQLRAKVRLAIEALEKIVLITERRTATPHGGDLKCQCEPYHCYCAEIELANLAKQTLIELKKEIGA